MTIPGGRRAVDELESAGSCYRFLDFELNQATCELSKAGAPVVIKPQSLAVLSYLIRHRDRTISGAELLRELWPGVVVSEGSLRQTIFELRRELADDAEAPRIVKTVRAKGYRFVAVLTAGDDGPPRHTQARSPDMGPRPSLFGRERELARLTELGVEALSKSGRACLVLGEAGIGKSRLLRDFADELRMQGHAVFETCAEQTQSAPPFWPWRQLLDGCLALADAALKARLEPPELTRQGASAKQEPPTLALEAERFSWFDQLTRMLVLLSSATPCVLVLDDLHWADEASLAFLAHLAPALGRTRILLLLGCRPVDRRDNRPLARALEALQRAPHNERLPLGRLSGAAIGHMLAAHGMPASADSIREVEALSQGNPLFSLELVRLAASRSQRTGLDLRVGPQLELLSLIGARLALLSEPCERAVAVASVIGRDFTLAELATLLAQTTSAALAHVDEGLRLGVFAARSELRYGFAHPLLQQAAYDSLARPERAALHLAFAEALEARGHDGSLGYTHELAHHFFRASAVGGAARAFQYNLRCAERAHDTMAYEAARDHYDRALECGDLLSELSAQARLTLEISRAEAARALAPGSTRLGHSLIELFERAEALEQPQLMARAALAYVGQLPARFVPTHLTGSDANETALLERALERLSAECGALRVLLLCSLSYSLGYTRQYSRCEAMLREALQIAERLAKPALMTRVLLLQLYVCSAPGTLPQRLVAADRLVEVTHRQRLPELELEARVARALCRLCAIDPDGAAQDAERARQLAHEIGSDHAHGRALVPALFQALIEGELDEAERLSQQAHDATGDDIIQRNIWMARTAWLAGFRSDSMRGFTEIFEAMLRTYPHAVGVHAALASNYASCGQREAAERHFDAVARDDFAALPRGGNWLAEVSVLAEAASRLGDVQRTRQVYDALLPYSDEIPLNGGEIGLGMPVSFWLGELAIVLGEFEHAQVWLDQARASSEKLGAHLLLQFCRLSEARLLFVSGRQRDVARQRALEVAAFAERCGAAWLRRNAQSLESDSLALRDRMISERALRPRSLRVSGDTRTRGPR